MKININSENIKTGQELLMEHRQGKFWISVSEGFKTEEYQIPYYDPNLLFWVYKSLNRQFDANTWLYRYELFLPDFHPMPFRIGNFACISIFEYCISSGGRIYRAINFEISDRNDLVRPVRGFDKIETGIIAVIEFMRTLEKFDDWADYDSTQKLAKSLGISDEELNTRIAGELDGTGIGLI